MSIAVNSIWSKLLSIWLISDIQGSVDITLIHAMLCHYIDILVPICCFQYQQKQQKFMIEEMGKDM